MLPLVAHNHALANVSVHRQGLFGRLTGSSETHNSV